MKQIFLAALVGIIIANSFAQDLYMPLEFRRAYENGTRKWDGTVSEKYTQNRSEYKIRATVDPYTKILRGEATITYHNNNADTIRVPTFHTYHDYYRPTSRKSGFFSRGEPAFSNHKGVVIEELKVNGEAVDLDNPNEIVFGGTNYTIRLKKPLPPKSTMQLTVKWNYEIPGEGFERSGAIDSTSMFIAYWYPEMAVLDDIDYWDRIVYDAATEFYHDYSDYEVEITLPDNFMVWASVPPSNPEEVYSSSVRARIEQARKSIEPVRIWSEADFRKSASGKKTWKFSAKDFPDFAFALSDHFLWEARSYTDQHGEYFIHVAYPTAHPEFGAVLKAIEESLKVFHNRFPVYPFPYKYFTIFNGLRGGGMEFPGMANDQEISGAMLSQFLRKKIDDVQAQLGLTLHEMCHMYFPFMMGIHEKKYAWMDEGFASFSEYFIEQLFENRNTDQPYLASQRVLPVMTPTHLAEGSAINSYTIGAQSYVALYHLLGRDMFLKCLHAYMDSWKHKHPTPYDFMFTFNRVSGQNLNWFWKKWYFDWGYMDIGITGIKGNVITIKNTGGRPVYFQVITTFDDGSSFTDEVSPAVWRNTDVYQHKVTTGKKKIKTVELKIPMSGDATVSDNRWPRQ
ncbi:MAG: M1 family metallopeptidase [Cyclobacteriaceae bacterium]|nr:M1 family metallopeptidase [Cyclobacteriaceae bacterium]MDW8331460.1 M1 family metallopeptidase [Cyclobacteriaceae bacterium]